MRATFPPEVAGFFAIALLVAVLTRAAGFAVLLGVVFFAVAFLAVTFCAAAFSDATFLSGALLGSAFFEEATLLTTFLVTLTGFAEALFAAGAFLLGVDFAVRAPLAALLTGLPALPDAAFLVAGRVFRGAVGLMCGYSIDGDDSLHVRPQRLANNLVNKAMLYRRLKTTHQVEARNEPFMRNQGAHRDTTHLSN